MFKQQIITLLLCVFIFTSCTKENVDILPSEESNITIISSDSILHPLGATYLNYEQAKRIGVHKLDKGLKALPTLIDYSNKFPAIGDQGSQGSCVGWAVGYYYKTFHEKVENGYCAGNVFSPSWVYNQINQGVDKGAHIEDALTLIVNKGCDFASRFFYSASNWTLQPTTLSFERASAFKAKSWRYLDNSIDNLKQVLVNGNTFVCGISVYSDFDYLNASNPIYDNVSGECRGQHALCVVGYDDSKQAFKVINSWGTSYGINGYAWISYNLIKNNSIGFVAFELVDGINTPSWHSFSPYYYQSEMYGVCTSTNCSINIIKTGSLTLNFSMTEGIKYKVTYYTPFANGQAGYPSLQTNEGVNLISGNEFTSTFVKLHGGGASGSSCGFAGLTFSRFF